MLSYLFRYQVARLLFSRLGAVIAVVLFFTLAEAAEWMAGHWIVIVLASMAWVVCRLGLPTRRR